MIRARKGIREGRCFTILSRRLSRSPLTGRWNASAGVGQEADFSAQRFQRGCALSTLRDADSIKQRRPQVITDTDSEASLPKSPSTQRHCTKSWAQFSTTRMPRFVWTTLNCYLHREASEAPDQFVRGRIACRLGRYTQRQAIPTPKWHRSAQPF